MTQVTIPSTGKLSCTQENVFFEFTMAIIYIYRSKSQDRRSPHKRIRLEELADVIIGPPSKSSFLESSHPPEQCFTLQFKNGQSIDIKVSATLHCLANLNSCDRRQQCPKHKIG
jgi:hypothetical protein